jgi:acetyl esterase/lipase
VEKVAVPSGGVQVAGDFYLPAGSPPAGGWPALVLGHGFSFIKEGLVNQGRRFAEAGYATLAIDYRTFGESEGQPRGQLFPLNEVDDFRNSISWLQDHRDVNADRIGIWGTSFGGAAVLWTAAVDRRVKAVVAQVPVVNGREWMRSLRTNDQWEDLLTRVEEDRRRRFRGEQGERIAVTGLARRDDIAAMPSDHHIVDFLMSAKESMNTWNDSITLESVEKIIEFDPSSVIEQIGGRALRIITVTGYDVIHPLDQILAAYDKAKEPKSLVLLPFHQMQMYLDEAALATGLDHAVEWFDDHLDAAKLGLA